MTTSLVGVRQFGRLSTLLAATAGAKKNGRTASTQSSVAQPDKLDAVQEELMKEPCIIVDENDVAIGMESKRKCHLFNKTNPKGILHRAFSVFLFNTDGELLLQKRASTKITFPGYFTNTCCSHPLYFPDEMEEDNIVGVRRAAQRKLEHELGIPKKQMPLDSFHYLTRIHYCSPSMGEWGEHEIDYILFAKRNVQVAPNLEEVEEVRYVGRKDIEPFLASLRKDKIPLTPWFGLIAKGFLCNWWDNLDNLDRFKDQRKTIYRL